MPSRTCILLNREWLSRDKPCHPRNLCACDHEIVLWLFHWSVTSKNWDRSIVRIKDCETSRVSHIKLNFMNRNIITEKNPDTAESLDLFTHEHNIWIEAILGKKDTKEMIIKSIIYPFYFNGGKFRLDKVYA